MKVLIELYGVDPGLKDNYGLNAAHYAAREGHLAILIYLAEHLTLEEEDIMGNTCIVYALIYVNIYCFVYLYFKRGLRLPSDRIAFI